MHSITRREWARGQCLGPQEVCSGEYPAYHPECHERWQRAGQSFRRAKLAGRLSYLLAQVRHRFRNRSKRPGVLGNWLHYACPGCAHPYPAYHLECRAATLDARITEDDLQVSLELVDTLKCMARNHASRFLAVYNRKTQQQEWQRVCMICAVENSNPHSEPTEQG